MEWGGIPGRARSRAKAGERCSRRIEEAGQRSEELSAGGKRGKRGTVPPPWGHEHQITETGFYTLGHGEPVGVSAGGDFRALKGSAVYTMSSNIRPGVFP